MTDMSKLSTIYVYYKDDGINTHHINDFDHCCTFCIIRQIIFALHFYTYAYNSYTSSKRPTTVSLFQYMFHQIATLNSFSHDVSCFIHTDHCQYTTNAETEYALRLCPVCFVC